MGLCLSVYTLYHSARIRRTNFHLGDSYLKSQFFTM